MTGAEKAHAKTLGDALWALIALVLGRFAVVFADVASLDPASRRAAGFWLRDLEALARRVLFAEAVALAVGVTFARRTWSPPPARATPPQRSFAAPVFKVSLCARPRTLAVKRPYTAPCIPHGRSLARRADALAALLADPAVHARKLARRMARRRERVPLMLLKLRRHHVYVDLRRVLGPVFTAPPEHLVGMLAQPPPRDGPYAIALTPDIGVSLHRDPRALARRARLLARMSGEDPAINAR